MHVLWHMVLHLTCWMAILCLPDLCHLKLWTLDQIPILGMLWGDIKWACDLTNPQFDIGLDKQSQSVSRKRL